MSEVKKKLKNREISTHDLRDYGVCEYDAFPIMLLEREGLHDQYDLDGNSDAIPMTVRITNNLRGQIDVKRSLTYLMYCGRFESAAKIDPD